VEGPDEINSADPVIPPKLLTRLLHRHFQDEKTKIAKDANRVVAKYVDVFVREALARAAYEKAEGERSGDIGDRRRDGYLEVYYSFYPMFSLCVLHPSSGLHDPVVL
jgi:hypothetical protein